MVEDNKDNPQKRIFDASVALFARRGYDGVGVREIAREANVNISMISYYYGGKAGILKSIIEKFHDKYYEAIVGVADTVQSTEEGARRVIKSIVDFIRFNTDLAMVAFDAMSVDIPEIADVKAEKVAVLIKGVSAFLRRFNLDPDDAFQIITVGPALLGIVMTHFRFRKVQAKVFGFEFNDEFYKRFADSIATLYLYGISGVAGLNREEKGNENEHDG